MQTALVTFRAGEGEQAVKLLKTLPVDQQAYQLIKSDSGDLLIINFLHGDPDILLDKLISKYNFDGDQARSLVIFTPDTVIPRNKGKKKQAFFHASRESLLTYAQEKSRINMEYILLLVFSSVIISLGLILDNIAVIVGGMVIGPVLGPLVGITIGIILGNVSLIRQGLIAEILAVVIAILLGTAFGYFIPNVEITDALRIRMYPTMADIFIALAAGAAGAYALIKGQPGASLVGVMVAASLMPVMSTIGIGISMGYQPMIVGASLLLAGNYLSLLLAKVVVFYLKGLKPQLWYKNKARKIMRRSLIFILLAVVGLSIPLGILTVYQFYMEKPVEIIKTIIRENLMVDWQYKVENIEIEGNLINAYLYAEKEIDERVFIDIKNKIERRLKREYNINFKIIPLKEINV